MGLVELITLSLCLNVTIDNCPGIDETFVDKFITQRNFFLKQLEDEIQYESFVVTSLNNEQLSGLQLINDTYIGTGVAFDLLEILRRKFHFNYTLIKPPKNIWGPGNDDGILSLLEQNKADLSAAFLPVVTEYSKFVTYSPSLDTGEWVVLMNRPKESATGSGLLAPFTLPVWILIVLSLLIIGPVIYSIIYIQAKLCKYDDNIIFPLPSCMWFVYGALLKQGTTLNPATDSSRLLFSTWWLFITILTAFYTANLTAFLTLSRFTLPINSAEDIGAKKSKWVSTQGNALQDVIQTDSTHMLQTSLGSRSTFVDDHRDEYILNNFVKNQGMMFIREKPIVEYVMYEDYKKKTRAQIDEDKRCTFVITKFSVVSLSRAFAYAKNFKYKPLFDSAIQHLVESGIVKYKLREGLPDTEICPHNLGNKERQLRNADLMMTYEIVAGGFVISSMIFIIELVVQKKKNGKSENPIKTKRTKLANDNYSNNNNSKNLWLGKERNPVGLDNVGKLFNNSNFITPPPPYNTLFTPTPGAINRNIKKKNINGRDYWIYDSIDGSRMVPVRSPSALLFQFAN